MTGLLEAKISVQDYLELEKVSELRYEFVDGELIEMPGTRKAHNEIIQNFMLALTRLARSKGCRMYGESIKLQTTPSKFRYPDVMLSCQPSQDDYLEFAPCFLAEILSDSTEITDYGAKVREYLALPSLQTYAIIAQTECLIVVYQRDEKGWRYQLLTEGQLELPCLETSLALEAIYEGIAFAEPADAAATTDSK